MLYLVSYTLSPPRAIPRIEEELKKSGIWWHHLDFTWIIETDETIDRFYRHLAIRFLDTDHFLILDITELGRFSGWLPNSAWEWLRHRKT